MAIGPRSVDPTERPPFLLCPVVGWSTRWPASMQSVDPTGEKSRDGYANQFSVRECGLADMIAPTSIPGSVVSQTQSTSFRLSPFMSLTYR